jgi:ribosomal-protein-serine acetyltransferase
MTQLHAAGFVLRPFVNSDAAAFAAAVRESASTIAVWMPWARADYAESDALDWFAMCDEGRANGSAYEFGIFRDDGVSLVGGAGLNHMNTLHAFCNLGYWVRASAQRQGAALASVKTLTGYAFEQLRLSRVEIVVAAGNAASMAVAHKAGATHECLARSRLQLHGRAVDGHVFSIISDS